MSERSTEEYPEAPIIGKNVVGTITHFGPQYTLKCAEEAGNDMERRRVSGRDLAGSKASPREKKNAEERYFVDFFGRPHHATCPFDMAKHTDSLILQIL